MTECSHFNSSACGFVRRSGQPGHGNLHNVHEAVMPIDYTAVHIIHALDHKGAASNRPTPWWLEILDSYIHWLQYDMYEGLSHQ